MAACGGKTVLLLGPIDDAGDDAAAGRPPASDAGRDSTAPPPDTAVPCPLPSTLVALGGPCDWAGTCSVDLDACDAGVGSPTACECVGNVVTLPPGTGIGCTHSTLGNCPAGLVIGGACSGDTVCLDDPCGTGNETTCSCENGAWECADAMCLPPTPQCVNGAPCDEGVMCQEPDGCETACNCVDQALQCATACSGGGVGVEDAGAGPLPICGQPGQGGGCLDGSCLGPDGCGGEVVCQCSENSLACPVVTC